MRTMPPRRHRTSGRNGLPGNTEVLTSRIGLIESPLGHAAGIAPAGLADSDLSGRSLAADYLPIGSDYWSV